MGSHVDEHYRRVAISCAVVAAYLRHNAVPVADVPGLIASVYGMMERLRFGEVAMSGPVEDRPRPATSARIRASIMDEALISFEDGKPYKTLKRHLTALGLSPNAYRAKWGLPANYPMVCAAYSQHRSALAKAIGLGRPGSLAEAAE